MPEGKVSSDVSARLSIGKWASGSGRTEPNDHFPTTDPVALPESHCLDCADYLTRQPHCRPATTPHHASPWTPLLSKRHASRRPANPSPAPAQRLPVSRSWLAAPGQQPTLAASG